MKYSIIIPYRNREEHLQVLLPVLIDKFSDESFEIIVSEQNDTDNFRISCVQNIAYNHAKGDVLIFHQVDYVPSEDVSYEYLISQYYPLVVVFFLMRTTFH